MSSPDFSFEWIPPPQSNPDVEILVWVRNWDGSLYLTVIPFDDFDPSKHTRFTYYEDGR